MQDATAFNLSMLVLRVVLGVVFLAHGINHVFRGGKIPGTARWFESLGMKPGILHAWLASLTELAAGLGLVVGLLTPLAAGAIFGVLAVALITNHRKAGFFVFRRPTEGWEYLMNLLAACVAIGCVGPGRWSLDNAVGFHPGGCWGLGIVLVIGLGGTVSLLAVFWRPPAPATAT